jgi:glucose/arabinose dehydrogenase
VLAADVDGRGPVKWETVLTGVRNPWRMTFDAALNELWIGDVGQDEWEEVDRVPFEPDEPPKNLGWPAYEGERRFDRELGDGELVAPVAVYSHDDGCSITGGVIYRGTRIPRLVQRYLFGDFCTGALWSVRARPGAGVGEAHLERVRVPQLTHIGTDADGELVLTTADGKVVRLVPV